MKRVQVRAGSASTTPPNAKAIVCRPHQAHPIACWCRKPMPGLGAYLIDRYRLARRHLVVVGNMSSDVEFAAGLGVRFIRAEHFFMVNLAIAGPPR